MSDVVSRIYGSFRGVDFRGEEVNIARSPDSVNMWKDYKETDSIRTRPSAELRAEFDAPIYGVFFYDTGSAHKTFIHSGTAMYDGAKANIISGDIVLNEALSQSFVYNGVFYFKDGKNYLFYDSETSTLKEVVPYIPTTSIGRTPKGGGTPNEDVNLLTGLRKNTFVGTGDANYLMLDTQNIDEVISVTINGAETDFKTLTDYDKEVGRVRRSSYFPEPATAGQDNIVVTFRKDVKGYPDKINNCTLLQVFDNRVFCSGNPDSPNVVWHCSLNDPTYWSDLDYYNEGLDESPIRGLVAGNNVLWVFREPSDANTTVFYHTPVIDSQYGKIYPGNHSSVATGCVGKAINFNDDIVFFSERGMEGISGDIATEQVIAHRSTLVDRKLTAEAKYKNMLLEEWEGYLLVFVGSKVYLADSRGMFTNENHVEYEWFYWDIGEEVTSVKVNGNILYIGTKNGNLCTLTGEGDVPSHWITPKDKFGYPQRQKTTNKRGCVVEATGDVSVYAKTESTDFEPIGEYYGVKDYFVSRIKKKKFKDLQLKFKTNTRFSLETAILETFVGGYIKR